jgi:hypothetical protein
MDKPINHKPMSKSHGNKFDYWMSFFAAALPQLIPGGGIIADYFKSLPTTYFFKKNYTTWGGDPFDHQVALANALWVGGQAVSVDIILSGFGELSNALPYLRAFVCGSANQEFNDPYLFAGTQIGAGKAFWESAGLEYWAANLAQGNTSDQSKLTSLHTLWAFLLGFMAMRNNVGGGAAASAALAGLATSSSMIVSPWVFENTTTSPPTFAIKLYWKIIIGMTLIEGLVARLLEGRVSPFALTFLIALMNASFASKEMKKIILPYLQQVVIPDPPLQPLSPSISRVRHPRSYTSY